MIRPIANIYFASVGILGILLLGTACDGKWRSEFRSQVSHSQFSNYIQAVESEVFQKGWIPEFLPTTATNILEWHNVETGRARVEFSFDTNSVSQWLNQKSFRLVTGLETNSLKAKLLTARGATIDKAGALQFYRVVDPREDGYLAVNQMQGRAQFWTRFR